MTRLSLAFALSSRIARLFRTPEERLGISVLATVTFLLLAESAFAHEFRAGSLEIDHPWARATAPGAPVAGGYATIRNDGAEADVLTGGSADIAGRVEIHEMAVTDGVMTMKQLPDGLEIPAGGAVTLKPGSYHIMFMDLKRQIKQGEHFAGTLTFAKAGTVKVEFDVESLGAREPEHEDDSH